MKKKLSSILMISFLAVAGIFGISSAVINKRVEEAPVIEKAKADYNDFSTSNFIYLDVGEYWTDVNKVVIECRNYSNQSWSSGAASTSLYSAMGRIWKVFFPDYGDAGYVNIKGFNGDTEVKHVCMEDNYKTSDWGWACWHNLPASGNVITLNGDGSIGYNDGSVLLTFYGNDGTGEVVKPCVKKWGVNFTIPSPDDIGMTASGGRYFDKWATNRDGSGTNYAPGATYSSNDSISIYRIQSWYSYDYSNDEGVTWVNMVRHSGSGDYDAIYYPSSNQTVYSAHSITIRRYKGDDVSTAEAASVDGWYNNNYDTRTNTVIYTCVGTVTLQIKRVGYHDIYMPGYSQRSIFVTHNGVVSKYHLTQSGSHFYTTVPAIIYPGDYIQGAYEGGAYELSSIKDGSGDFTYDGSATHHVVCNAPGVFTVWLMQYGVNYPDVRFDMHETETASLFASTFNSEIGSDCSAILDNKGSFNDLLNTWGLSSSEANTMYRYYNSLTSTAKGYLVSDDSGSDIDLMVKKYDYILGKYGYGAGAGKLKDFMGRTPPVSSSIRSFTPFTMFNDSSDNLSTIIIIIASSVALLSVTALSILVIKKRKQKEE